MTRGLNQNGQAVRFASGRPNGHRLALARDQSLWGDRPSFRHGSLLSDRLLIQVGDILHAGGGFGHAGAEHRHADGEEDQPVRAAREDDAEEHLEEDAKGLAGGECEGQDGQEGGAHAQEDGLAHLLHGQLGALGPGQAGVLQAEAVGHVHGVVHHQAHSHDKVDHGDGVQGETPKHDVAHEVHEDQRQDQEHHHDREGMRQDQGADEQHRAKAEPNAGRHLLHDDAVLVEEDVGLRAHEASGQRALPLLREFLRLLEHGDLLSAVESIDVIGPDPGHFDLSIQYHHIICK